jgi:hypothetical protein
MTDQLSPPSYNTSDFSTLSAAMNFVLRKYLQDTDDMLPAQVIAYNRTTNRAQVQIMVPMVTTNNQVVQRAPIASVPVLQLGGGGFVVSFPINPGDLGWIKANDRDISIFNATLNNSSGPPTQRLHKFSDAMFIPDTMMNNVTIASEDANNLVIQNTAGTVKLSWWSTFLKIVGRLGIGGSPNANAMLDVQSTTKASMPFPRMTTSQRNAISSPQEGFCIWNLDTHGINTYNGVSWS